MHIVVGVLKKVQVNFTEIVCNIFSLNRFYNHMFSQNRAYGGDSINWYSLPCGDWVFWLGKEYLNLFTPWLKALYNCHNWPSRWFPTLIMRISHLIQTIQPDPQILTSVHGGDSFSKTNNDDNKKLLNKAYFILIFHWLVRQWSSRPDLTSEKCPENNWKSTWTKQPEIASWMCHSFSPFNHELSCNSLNSPWHQTKLKVSVFYIHTKYIHTYSEMPQIRSYIFWSLAK